MANLEKQTRELFKEADKMFDECMGMVGVSGLFDLDDPEFEMFKHCIKLYKAANELAVAQAKQLDDMNAKLDKLLLK